VFVGSGGGGGGGGGAAGPLPVEAPQVKQKAASSANFVPHFAQNAIEILLRVRMCQTKFEWDSTRA
jgi:hypothetical protein